MSADMRVCSIDHYGSFPVEEGYSYDPNPIPSGAWTVDFKQMMMTHQNASRPGDGPHPNRAPLNINHYVNKKSAAESMLDVALLMANASQLKAVLVQGPQFSFYVAVLTLISISICLQIVVGILLIFMVRWNLNDEHKHWRLDVLENVATGLVFIIVVVNVFITALGVQKPDHSG